jgi:CO/xanthine dehydrogenase FAD-binding subunit
MQPFAYVAPSSLEQAVALLAQHGAEAKVLAGGQSLIPILNYRLAQPRVVIDIGGLPLDATHADDGRLRLGALTRHVDLEESSLVARDAPLLREAVRLVGNVRVRALGTLGGSLAHADPAAELPMAMLALDACVTAVSSRGSRTVDAAQLFTGYLTTALAADEILTEVDVPVTRSAGAAVEEQSRRTGDFAIVAVAAVVTIDRRGRLDDVRLAYAGVGATPLRARGAEDALRGHEPTSERIARAADIARGSIEPASDAFVSAAYRKLLVGVLTRRALARAVSNAMAVA